MKVLVLDDSKERLRNFKQKFIGNTVVCVETAQEAIEQLLHSKWDIVFLDHDLGGKVLVESGKGTGYEVAKWLANNPEKQPAEIVLHSFNVPGRNNMLALLPNAIVAPRVWV